MPNRSRLASCELLPSFLKIHWRWLNMHFYAMDLRLTFHEKEVLHILATITPYTSFKGSFVVLFFYFLWKTTPRFVPCFFPQSRPNSVSPNSGIISGNMCPKITTHPCVTFPRNAFLPLTSICIVLVCTRMHLLKL